MNTIMHIAHNAKSAKHRGNGKQDTSNIRLLVNVDNTEIHLFNGVTQRLEVVHSSDHTTDPGLRYTEELIASQKKVADAVRLYEDRIYKRVPPDIA